MHVVDLMYMHVSCNMHGFGTFFMHVTCILHDNKHAHDIHVYRQQDGASPCMIQECTMHAVVIYLACCMKVTCMLHEGNMHVVAMYHACCMHVTDIV